MAKARYILTKFWADNFIVKLNPLERYLFLYFLTNEHTNICGIYELPLRTMAFETGIDEEMLPIMIKRLDGKIYYMDGWLYITNFMKNQLANKNVKIGIENALNDIPKHIVDKFQSLNKVMSEGLFTNTNTNTNTNKDINTYRRSEPPRTPLMALETPLEEKDEKSTETFKENSATLKKLIADGEFQKSKYSYSQEGPFDWRYVIDSGKRLTPAKYMVGLFWKEQQTYKKFCEQFGVSYDFPKKDKASALLVRDLATGKQLADSITFDELPKLVEVTDEAAWDDKNKTYWQNWKISTLLKNIQLLNE